MWQFISGQHLLITAFTKRGNDPMSGINIKQHLKRFTEQHRNADVQKYK